jgi:hypothetical protein
VFGILGGLLWGVYLLLPVLVLYAVFRGWKRLTSYMDRIERELVLLTVTARLRN